MKKKFFFFFFFVVYQLEVYLRLNGFMFSMFKLNILNKNVK